MDKQTELKNLIQKRDRITTGFFWLALKTALIIGIPAFIGAYFGKKLDAANGKNLFFTLIFLAVAFVISWTIIYFEYKKVSKKLKDIEEEIKEIKKELIPEEK